MQIVTDSGATIAESILKEYNIHVSPLSVTLHGKTYLSGVDISAQEFYRLLSETSEFPMTSQPTPGDFATLYREIAKTDPEILSIHISSGLSGTMNSAQTAASMVPEAKVTFWDSKTLAGALGLQVQAAAMALRKGWDVAKIFTRLEQIRKIETAMFTLKEMRYLVHGGRVSHIKGLMAQVLNIKPIIGVDKERGVYETLAQDITFKRSITKLISLTEEKFRTEKDALCLQIMEGFCPDGVETIKQKIKEKLNVATLEVLPVSPVLGAHTGPSLTGLIALPQRLLADLV